MDTKKINQLISKYYSGQTSLQEEQELRTFFNNDNVPEELEQYADQFRYYQKIKKIDSERWDPFAKINFAGEPMADAPGDSSRPKTTRVHGEASAARFTRWSMRIAAGIALLLVGFAGGRLLSDGDYASNDQVVQLQEEVQLMKNVLMSSGTYSNVSAGERLAVVNSSAQIPMRSGDSDEQISDILIYTMNNDKNVNVRMAAAEALFRFRDEPRVRRALIGALARQDEPLMQITLINMLVELKAKDAIQEMEKMLVDTDTRDVVRDRLETGIAELKI